MYFTLLLRRIGWHSVHSAARARGFDSLAPKAGVLLLVSFHVGQLQVDKALVCKVISGFHFNVLVIIGGDSFH